MPQHRPWHLLECPARDVRVKLDECTLDREDTFAYLPWRAGVNRGHAGMSRHARKARQEARGEVAVVETRARLDLAAVGRRFPGWSLWHSDMGRCWATRLRPVPRKARGSYAMTVDGDTPDQLAQAIEAAEEATARSGP